MAMRHGVNRFLLIGVFGLISGCSGFFDIFDNTPEGALKPIAVVPEGGFVEKADSRILAHNLASIKLLPAVGGAILMVDGVMPAAGYYDAELVPENQELPTNGQLTYQFRVMAPAADAPTSDAKNQVLTVGRFISDGKLADARRIKVVSEARSLAVSR